MGRWWAIWFRLRGLLGGRRVLEEVDEEFQFHIDQATERNRARGLAPDAARREALRRFGGRARHREAAGDERSSAWLEGVVQDIRFAARALRRNPAFSGATLLLISLGVGANAAIFSVVDGVLLKPLPFADPGRVHFLGWDYGNGRSIGALSFHQLDFVRREAATFEAAATWRSFERALGGPDDLPTVRGVLVSEDFFPVIGRPPTAGRDFLRAEFVPGTPDVAIVSEQFRRRRLGDGQSAIGREFRLDGRPYLVVGTIPAPLRLPGSAEPYDLVLPLQLRPDPNNQGANYTVAVRMGSGADREAVRADLERISSRFAASFPEVAGAASPPSVRPPGFSALEFEDVFVGDLERLLWVLFAAVGVVTLIVCVNAANLLLTRAVARQPELAVRSALGAGRGRIIRQLLVESLLLALTAGVIGLGMGYLGLEALLALAPRELPRAEEIGLDWRVAAFTGGVALLTGLAFGLMSAVTAARGGRLAAAGRMGRGTVGGRRRLREAFIVAETALAVVLVGAAGLLLTSFARLRAVDPGFESSGVVTARVTRMPAEYREEARRWEFERLALAAVRAIPGVLGAATLSNFPLERGVNLPITIEGRPDATEGAVETRWVSDGYFETLQIPLLRGRAFQSGDAAVAPRVAIANASFAERYWPDQDPLGKRVELGRWQGRWLSPGFEGAVTIIGIVADMREIDLGGAPRRTLFVPRAQWSDVPSSPLFVVRTGTVAGLEPLIAAAIQAVEPRMPAVAMGTLPAIVRQSIAEQRFQTVLLAIFGSAALFLTAIGIYGVTAYDVARRSREIGLRMALGAPAGRVIGLILRRGMGLVSGGIGVGLLGALAATRLLRGMLYQVSPTDPRTLTLAIGVLAAAALTATLLPARRATRFDPTEALRME